MLVRSRLRPRKRSARSRSGFARSLDQRRRGLDTRRRCPICGTLVGPGDALGSIGGKPAHAECALVDWLRAPERGISEHSRGLKRTVSEGDELPGRLEALERLRGLLSDGGS